MRYRARPPKGDWNYKQLWRIVDGALIDCFAMHPGYLSDAWPERVIRESICKRVTGSVIGYAEQSARGRSVEETAVDMMGGVRKPPVGVGSPLARAWRWVVARRHRRGGSAQVASP